MTNKKILQENFPFLTLGTYIDEEYIGIIQNVDNSFVNMYVLDEIRSEEKRNLFLELGDMWWWESNRILPINIFLKGPFNEFKYCLRTFNKKEFKLIFGHMLCLRENLNKKSKRRNIQLVR